MRQSPEWDGAGVARIFRISRTRRRIRKLQTVTEGLLRLYFYLSSRSVDNDDEESDYYTLTFNIDFQHDNDTVYFAHSYPYTYTDLQVRSFWKLYNKDNV